MSEAKHLKRRVVSESEVVVMAAPDAALRLRSGGSRPPKSGGSPAPAGSGLAPTGGPGGPALKYFFSLSSVLTPVSNGDSVGFEVPEGMRLHINYESRDGQVSTTPRLYQASWGHAYNPNWADGIAQNAVPYRADDWYGIHGKIRSGGDWILIQKDGVARFDARVTIESVDNVLVDAVFTGAVDLRAAVSGLTTITVQDVKDLGKNVYDAYLNQNPANPLLPIALSVRFEASAQPYLRPGEDGSWIDRSRYTRQRKNFWRYQKLVRSLFVARGAVTLGIAKQWPPQRIDLDIYALA